MTAFPNDVTNQSGFTIVRYQYAATVTGIDTVFTGAAVKGISWCGAIF